jgi:hypothetical protein
MAASSKSTPDRAGQSESVAPAVNSRMLKLSAVLAATATAATPLWIPLSIPVYARLHKTPFDYWLYPFAGLAWLTLTTILCMVAWRILLRAGRGRQPSPGPDADRLLAAQMVSLLFEIALFFALWIEHRYQLVWLDTPLLMARIGAFDAFLLPLFFAPAAMATFATPPSPRTLWVFKKIISARAAIASSAIVMLLLIEYASSDSPGIDFRPWLTAADGMTRDLAGLIVPGIVLWVGFKRRAPNSQMPVVTEARSDEPRLSEGSSASEC